MKPMTAVLLACLGILFIAILVSSKGITGNVVAQPTVYRVLPNYATTGEVFSVTVYNGKQALVKDTVPEGFSLDSDTGNTVSFSDKVYTYQVQAPSTPGEYFFNGNYFEDNAPRKIEGNTRIVIYQATDCLCGDFDCNGKVDEADVEKFNSYLLGREKPVLEKAIDVNNDGIINLYDVQIVKAFVFQGYQLAC
ncbi:hypothetical protein C4573_06085 [Candidatus Woesearchaeota archaeon]|nr:MAG: hypothetical protein C4573_06085 [Candidatus Woesearchaeota archaeon]